MKNDWYSKAENFIKIRRKKSFAFKPRDKFSEIWHNIKQRCNNPNNPSYKYYGGRKIGFLITQEDIIRLWFRDNASSMKRPSIDRIDNNGHYTYQNCRFIELSNNIKKSNLDRKSSRKVVNYLFLNS